MNEQDHTTCFTDTDKHKLFSEIGYIRKGVDDNTEQIKRQNGNVTDLRKKVDTHDVFIGKIGAIMATMTFFASIVFAAVINFAFKNLK